MISLKHKFLFIHVPKTGGNSLQIILRDYSEDEIIVDAPYQDGVERFEVRNPRYQIVKHSTLSDYRSVIEPEVYAQLFKFGTLRNPWDRMVSLYFSPHRGVTRWDRNDFLALIESTPPIRHHILEQPSYSVAGRLDRDLDCLLRFENLEQDFFRVCDRLGIARTTLPQRNRSQHAHYAQYYNAKLRALVARKFAEEIEFGGYRF